MITCANCGKQFNEPVEFCSRCGAPIDETMYDDIQTLDNEDDILSINDLDDIEMLMSGISSQQLDPQLLESTLKEADEDGNGLISLEELFTSISTILDEENANIFCDHFAETKNFTENGEVPIEEVVDMWIEFSAPTTNATNLDNVVVIKEILDAYKQERQFLDPTNILLDDEIDEFSYSDSFDDMIDLIDVNKDGTLTDKEVRAFLSNFIPEQELEQKVSAFMEELNAKQSTDNDSGADLFVDIDKISEIERSLEILDINSQITEDAKSDVDELLDELNLPNFKNLSVDNIFSEFDEEEDTDNEPDISEDIKPIFSRVRVKSAPVPEDNEEEVLEKKDLSSLLDASDEELEALLNESGGDLDDIFDTNPEEEFKVPTFSIDNIFDDFDETPVEELANKLNNNFQYDEDDDDDEQERFPATQRNFDDDDDNDDDDDDFESQFITDDYSPDIYEESTDEDFSGVFEELLVAPDNFDEKVEQDEIDEALQYIKDNSDSDVSDQVSARINKDYENYEDVFKEAANNTTTKDAIFEEDPDIADISAMSPDEFFTNEELTNALLDIKDITDKKKEKKVEEKNSVFGKIKSKFFVDVKTGTINTALIITLLITVFSIYYVQEKPYQNTFYTNYSEDVLTLYDQDVWDAYLSVVGFNDLFLMYADAYLAGELSKSEFLDIGDEYISHNTRASKTFLTNTYPESVDYSYNLHLYTFKFTDIADHMVAAVREDAPKSTIQSYLDSMKSFPTVDTQLLLDREKFLNEVGLYN